MMFSISRLTLAIAIAALIISFFAIIDSRWFWAAYFIFHALEKMISLHKENIKITEN